MKDYDRFMTKIKEYYLQCKEWDSLDYGYKRSILDLLKEIIEKEEIDNDDNRESSI